MGMKRTVALEVAWTHYRVEIQRNTRKSVFDYVVLIIGQTLFRGGKCGHKTKQTEIQQQKHTKTQTTKHKTKKRHKNKN